MNTKTTYPPAQGKTQGGHNVNFLPRILDALDLLPMEAAQKFGVPLKDILDMYKGSRRQVIEADQDELWAKIADHIDLKIAHLLSVRAELQRKLNLERADRTARRLRTLNR